MVEFLTKTIILFGLAGYQIIMGLVGYVPYPARPRYMQICVYPRALMTFISENCTFVFFEGAAWTPRLRSPSPIMAPAWDLFFRVL